VLRCLNPRAPSTHRPAWVSPDRRRLLFLSALCVVFIQRRGGSYIADTPARSSTSEVEIPAVRRRSRVPSWTSPTPEAPTPPTAVNLFFPTTCISSLTTPSACDRTLAPTSTDPSADHPPRTIDVLDLDDVTCRPCRYSMITAACCRPTHNPK
jgi:hypothetical protein